ADPTSDELTELRALMQVHDRLRVIVRGPVYGSRWLLLVDATGAVVADGLAATADTRYLPDSEPDRAAPFRTLAAAVGRTGRARYGSPRTASMVRPAPIPAPFAAPVPDPIPVPARVTALAANGPPTPPAGSVVQPEPLYSPWLPPPTVTGMPLSLVD